MRFSRLARSSRLACLTALPLLLTTPIWAEPATPEGAAQLTQSLQTYFGKTPGVVLVQPMGDGYGLRLDPLPLLSKVDPAVKISMTPLEFQLIAQGDGLWAVAQDQALALTIDAGPELQMALNFGHITATGVFDATLMAFTTSNAEVTGINLEQAMKDPALGDSTARYAIDKVTYQSDAKANPAGGVDGASSYRITGFAETMTFPAGADLPPMDLTISTDIYSVDSKMIGLRSKALADLLAFFVAHPSEVEVKAGQAALKVALTQALPLFDRLETVGTVGPLTIGSPLGDFGLTDLRFEVDANGAVANGSFREAISFAGLTMPAGILPDWATPLVPVEGRLDFRVDGFDLAAPSAMLLDALDLSALNPIPAGIEAQLLAALLPTGELAVSMPTGHVANDTYKMTFDGTMNAGPSTQIPTGQARVQVLGWDAVLAALQAAPPEMTVEMIPAFMLVGGMARAAKGGGLEWVIDATAPGKVLINGMDMTTLEDMQ